MADKFLSREITKFGGKIIQIVVMSKLNRMITKMLETFSIIFLFDHLGVVPTKLGQIYAMEEEQWTK